MKKLDGSMFKEIIGGMFIKAKYNRMDFVSDLCDLFKLPKGTIWADIHMSAVDTVLVSCEYEVQTLFGYPAIEGKGLDAKIKTMKKKYKVKLEEIEEESK